MRAVALIGVLAACGRIGFAPRAGALDDSGAGGDDGPDGAHPMIASNVVFVTPATLTPGSFGGFVEADATCQMLAMQAGLAGTYVAYLSTTTVGAVSRLGTARGWSRPDGMPFVDTIADLAAGRTYLTPSVLADGTRASGVVDTPRVMTGSTATGTSSGSTCTDYTSTTSAGTFGRLDTSGTRFGSSSSGVVCGANQRIYCFGIDRAIAVAAPALTVTARHAFVSSPWTPSGGLTGADLRCQADATTAGLTGTYRALLSTASASAAARLDPAGLPWARLDGVLLAPTAAGVLTGAMLEPIELTFDRKYTGGTLIWAGGSSVTQATNTTTCNDWQASSSGQQGGYGDSSATDFSFFYSGTQACNIAAPLYCLEM